jgi:protein TonB
MIVARHWIVAGSLAVSVHAGAFYAVFYNPVEGSQAIGSQGIEFGLGMVGDLGAAVETSAAQEEVKESEEPLEEPIKEVEEVEPEVIEEPEAIEPEPIIDPEPIIKPELIEPEPVEVKQESSIEVKKVEPKPEAIVESDPIIEPTPEPQKIEKPVIKAEPKQVAPPSEANLKATTGTGNSASSGGNPGAKASYTNQLLSILAQNKRYPRASRRRNEEGVVTLSFIAHADGSVSNVSIAQSSGYKRLDKAVLDMIRKSTPLPKFSDDMTETELKISLPVSFKLSDFN